MVQAAIDASPVAASKFSVPDKLTENESPSPRIDRPRLRLVEVSDVPVADVAVVAEAKPTAANTHFELLASVLSAFGADECAASDVVDESPMIIIDDDTLPEPPKPAVRREDYRHLFSRLRSG